MEAEQATMTNGETVESDQTGAVPQESKKSIAAEKQKIAEKLRFENAELLRRLNSEILEQQSSLRQLVDGDEIVSAHEATQFAKEILADYFRDIVWSIRRDTRSGKIPCNPDNICDEYLLRCGEVIPQERDKMLAIPVSGIGRVCRLVVMTDPKFVRDELCGPVSTELTKICIVSGQNTIMSDALSVLKIIRSRLESSLAVLSTTCISNSGLTSRKSSTKNSPLIMPIELESFISS
jgi:hypothetical protein